MEYANRLRVWPISAASDQKPKDDGAWLERVRKAVAKDPALARNPVLPDYLRQDAGLGHMDQMPRNREPKTLEELIMISLTSAKQLVLAGSLAAGSVFWAQGAVAQVADISPVLDEAGAVVPGGIASLERVTLGGVEQTILIRTQDTSLPVMLFLHGGPGGAIIPWVDLFHTPRLEETFTVVHWDQRGAGSSYSPDLPVEEITPENVIADTLELTDLLRDRFGQEKIFLSGQSWGSALGFLTLMQDSSPYIAFIAISERVAWNRSLTMGFDWATDQAQKNGDAEVLAQLQAIRPFDPLDEPDLVVQRNALEFYGAGDIHTEGLWDTYLAYVMDGKSPYYTMEQVQAYIPGLELSSAGIERPEFLGGYDLFTAYPKADIPVHFITGAEDWNTPADLAFEYYEALDAPAKSFTRIEDAAHMVMWDQPDAWVDALVRIKHQTLHP